jgi:CHASE1-domain containing sensor protein
VETEREKALHERKKTTEGNQNMNLIALILQPLLAAAGYSMLYLLFGGGIGGAVLIFIVAKMLGK